MYPELDGTFPNHPADPIQPENQRDLIARVLETGADIGLAFDGDADRVFLVDEKGNGVSGSLTTALVATRVLAKEPGATIIHNLICSKVVPEVVRENGGTPVRTRVGHSFIKQVMAETGAAFGGEHSGHYYFRDNFRADSGLIAALMVLDAVSTSGKPLSELLAPLRSLRGIGRDQHARRRRARGHRARRRGLLGLRAGSARRSHGRRRLVVVQPAAEQHRTAVAPQPRSAERHRVRTRASRKCAATSRPESRTTDGARSHAARDPRAVPRTAARSTTSSTRTRCTTRGSSGATRSAMTSRSSWSTKR